MQRIESKSSNKLKGGIIICFLLGTALLVMNIVRGDNTPWWAIAIFWTISFLAAFMIKTVIYEKHAITTKFWITGREKKLDTYNIVSLQIKLNEKSQATNMGLMKRTRIIHILGENNQPLHYVDETFQDSFEEILAMLKEGFPDKWLPEDLT